MANRSILLLLSALFITQLSSSDSGNAGTAESKPRSSAMVIGWVLPSKAHIGSEAFVGPYFLPTDQCYGHYLNILPDDAIRFYKNQSEAEKAGFIHSRFGIAELGKYCDVCSPMYGYYWVSFCRKVLLSSEKETISAGFQAVERFDLPSYSGTVLAFEGGRLYYTPCDPEYDCLRRLEKAWQSLECNQGMQKTKVLSFNGEREAREAGYYPGYKYFYDEGQVDF